MKRSETASTAKRDMVHFQKRKKAIHRLIFMSSFVLLCFVIFYPWMQIRRSGADSLDYLLRRHIASHSETVSTAVEDALLIYETASRLLFGLIEIEGDGWISGNYSGIIRVCTAVRNSIELQPPLFVIGNNQTFLRLNYSGSSVTVDTIIYETRFSGNETNWRNVVVGDVAYMSVFVGNENLQVGILIAVDVFAELLVPIANAVEGRMVLLDRNNGVMIEDAVGVIEIVGIAEFAEPVYPKLDEFGSRFWSAVNEWWVTSGPDRVRSIEIDNVEYLFFETVVSPSVADAYRIVTVFPFGDTIANVFYMTSLVLVSTIVLLFLVVVAVLAISRKIKMTRQRKLVMEPFLSECPVSGHKPFAGVLGNSIEKLRMLQLRFPEDATLNRVLDVVVSNLSKPKDKLWSVEAMPGPRCTGLCKFLVTPDPKVEPMSAKRPFKAWAGIRTAICEGYPELGTLEFPIHRHLQDPIHQLLTLMVTILVKEELLFPQFDPDGLLMFMRKTATRYCKDNIHTAHLIFTLYYFLNNPFKNWIVNKLDLFVIYFAAFVYDTDFTAVFDFDKDDEFSESTEEVWHDHSNENSSESDSESKAAMNHLRLHMTAFNDDESILSRNVQLTLELFHEFIQINPNDPISSFVETTVTDILFSIDNNKQFSLLGEFCVRSESSDFSVSNRLPDRILFMKALLKLCDFCQCYTRVDGSAEEQERWVQRILLNDDQSAAPSFHYDHARLIVAPWISQFVKFDRLTEVVNNFDHYLTHWKIQI